MNESHFIANQIIVVRMLVLPHVFIVHLAHGASNDLLSFRKSTNYQRCVAVMKDEFSRELDAKYGSRSL